jgi:hypothetical protein
MGCDRSQLSKSQPLDGCGLIFGRNFGITTMCLHICPLNQLRNFHYICINIKPVQATSPWYYIISTINNTNIVQIYAVTVTGWWVVSYKAPHVTTNFSDLLRVFIWLLSLVAADTRSSEAEKFGEELPLNFAYQYLYNIVGIFNMP